MARLRLALALGATILASSASAAELDLMPAPRSVTAGTGTLAIGPAFNIGWATRPTPLLERAAARFAADLRRATGLPTTPGAVLVPLAISVGADPGFLAAGAREHYRLEVDASGVKLTADGPAGVLDGLSTLLQLVQQDGNTASLPQLTIDDAPRFTWRGLMVDTSRHFVSVPTIERELDAMERVKLDVLHLHLSDAQGFRVESRVLPLLAKSGSHGEFYTQAQIRELVRYAADRGIRVVPEFDLPGHALALLQAYPKLAAASLDKADQNPEPDDFAIDPSTPMSLKLVAALYREMAGLFPDRYFHAGGDEVRAEQWTGNPGIVAYMAKHHFADPAALQGWFTGQVAQILAHAGKTMIGWDEVLAAPVPQDVAVEVWRSSKWIATAAKAGHPVVVSSGYYLDLLQPAAQHYAVDPDDPTATGLDAAALAAIAKTGKALPSAGDFGRDPNAVLPPADAHLVLGGEAPLWAENVTDEMLDGRLWPRAAAIAERFWSPANLRDAADMERRMYATADRLELLGLQAQANRARMIDRLAPGDTAPVAVLVDAASPVRNYAINTTANRSLARPVTLTGLAEIAEPDSRASWRATVLVHRMLAGDHTAAAALRTLLTLWQGNDAAYADAARRHPGLAAALPTSHDLADLGAAGLAALAVLDGHPDAGGLAHAQSVVAGLQAAIAASADTVRATTVKQPPADLLLPGSNAVGRLVEAARSMPSSRAAAAPAAPAAGAPREEGKKS